jgi:ribosomal protein S18 acetylase RimI-like enzyme
VIRLVPATIDHIDPIARNMRAWDVAEATAFGHSPHIALRMGLAGSFDCYTALIDDKPEAMLGLVPKNILEGEGSPWMLGTDKVYEHPRAVLVLSRKVVAIWSDSTPRLRNLVAAGNVRAIRYLRRLGFTIGKEPVVIGGTEFVTFTLERR